MANTETHPDYPAPYAPNPKLTGDLRTQVIDAIRAAAPEPAAVTMRDIISTGVQLHLTERRRDYIKATGMTNAEAVSALIDLAISSIKPEELGDTSKGIGKVSPQVSKVSADVSSEIVPIPCMKPTTTVHDTSAIPAAPAPRRNRWLIGIRGTKTQIGAAVACLAVIIACEVVGFQNLVNRILPPPTTALIQVDHP